MKNLKIFPKMFLQIFTALVLTALFIHFMVFLIFPKTYLEDRKQEINKNGCTRQEVLPSIHELYAP